jgi:hypothetical protein
MLVLEEEQGSEALRAIAGRSWIAISEAGNPRSGVQRITVLGSASRPAPVSPVGLT